MAELVLGRLKFKWQGNWVGGTNYIKDDIVRYGGNVYVAVENFTSDADFYVDVTANRWELMVAGQDWKGAWVTGLVYKVNDIVAYGPSTYICITGHTSSALFTDDSANWQSLTRGIGTEGAYQEGVRYQVNDVVTYGGAVYICILDHDSDESTDTKPTNADYWLKFVDGFQFEGDYDNAKEYQLGDVVVYGEWSYIARQDTVGNAPDAEGNLYWDVLTKGYFYNGPWSSSVEYKTGEIVQLGGEFWTCVKTHTDQVPPDNTYWAPFAKGFKFSGTWSDAIDYYPGEVVTYGGNLYVCQAAISITDPTDTNYWSKFVEGFDFQDEWDDAVIYKPGHVVKYGARMYLMHTQSGLAGTTPTDTNYWEQLSNGMRWRGSWSNASIYLLDDVVEYAQSSYICILGNSNQLPSDGAPYWELVAQGDANAVLTTRGDIIVRTETQVERLPLGPAGSFLYSDGSDVKWGHITPQSEYYVSIEGNDSNDGRTPTSSWRTLAHACTQTYNLGQVKINIAAGVYEELCPMKIGRNVVIEGNGLGAVTISPENAVDKGYGIGISTDGSTPNANSDVFQANNGSRLRNIVFRGFGEGSVQVALDPGYGPDDTSVWITSQSPYVQNCTNFSPGGTGMLIDGSLHNGGYKSAVANDWTQINSDGIGIHVKSDARVELVSVFTYYCNIGYLAESGGKIRALVGNNSYGEYGAVARGFSQLETPLDGKLQLADETLNSVIEIASNVHVFTSYRDEFGSTFYVGHTNPTGTDVTSTFDNTASYPFIMKLNNAGALDWIYTYEGDFGALHSAVELSERIYCGGVLFNGGQNKGFILSISKSGEIQWQKVIGDTSEIVDLAADSDNLYAVGNHATTGIAVIKTNPSGVEIWSNTIETDDESSAQGVITASSCTFAGNPTTSEDRYLIEDDGTTAANNLFIAGYDTFANSTIITRVDSLGNYVRAYTLGDIRVNKLRLDRGNGDGIYLAGAGYYDNAGTDTPLVFRMSPEGDIAWQAQISNGAENGQFKDVLPFGNDVYVAGYLNEGTNNNNAGIVARLSSTGAKTWIEKVDDGTNNVALNGVALDGVNVIVAGIKQADSVIYNFQRDLAFGLGTVTSGSYDISSGYGVTLANNTVINAGIENTVATSLTLGTTNTNNTLNQSPAITRAAVATRQGFAGIGTGTTFQVNSLERKPKDGSVLQINGDNETYFVIDVANFIETDLTPGNFPNSRNLLTLNKTWMQKETIGWINYQITNDIAPFTNAFVYNSATCERDIGLIIDALIDDLDLATNAESIEAARAYYTTASLKNYIAGQEAETRAALVFLQELVGNAINQSAVSETGYPFTAEVQQTGVATAEAEGITLTTNNFNEILSIYDNGRDSYSEKIGFGRCQISVDPAIPSNKTPNDNTHLVFREAFSQVRMTGHDFLDIGTGGFADTNYPVIIQEDYTQKPNQDREVDIQDGGRVFYVTTDQDGDFRVGDYFKVEQATGRATLSSEEFDLTGLNELQLGSITAGKAGATINEFSTDGTMADNSDTSVPTERAVVTYVSNRLGAFDISKILNPSQSTRVETNENDGEEILRLYANGIEQMTISGDGVRINGHTWQDITASTYTASAGDNVFVNTQANPITITLPAAPTVGDTIKFVDGTSNFDTNNLTVARNGANIMGDASDLTVSTRNATFGLVYYNATYGWRLIEV